MEIVLYKQTLVLFTILIWTCIRIYVTFSDKRKGKKILIKKEVLLNLLFIYLICVFSVTFFPLCINSKLNIIRLWINHMIFNILLLIPLGVLLPMLFGKFKNMYKLLLLAFIFSLTKESFQIIIQHVGSIDGGSHLENILLNTFGAWLGFMIYCYIYKKVKNDIHNKEDINFKFLKGI